MSKALLFARLDEDEQNALAEFLGEKGFEKGERLFTRGDPGGTLYLICSGRVEVFLEDDVGETIVLGEGQAGDILGETSLFDGGARSASAVAVEDTLTSTLDRCDMLSFLSKHPHAALDLLAAEAGRLRHADDLLRRPPVSRNLNWEHHERLTFGERLADHVAAFGGSWTFLLLFLGMLFGWMGINLYLLVERPFDPYPFILLNLVLSTIAAFQAPVIMMSQNRQARKDRLRADLDYEVNLKAELEIAALHTKVDRLIERIQAHFPTAENTPSKDRVT